MLDPLHYAVNVKRVYATCCCCWKTVDADDLDLDLDLERKLGGAHCCCLRWCTGRAVSASAVRRRRLVAVESARPCWERGSSRPDQQRAPSHRASDPSCCTPRSHRPSQTLPLPRTSPDRAPCSAPSSPSATAEAVSQTVTVSMRCTIARNIKQSILNDSKPVQRTKSSSFAKVWCLCHRLSSRNRCETTLPSLLFFHISFLFSLFPFRFSTPKCS